MLGRLICGGAFIAVLRNRVRDADPILKQLARQGEWTALSPLGTLFACRIACAVTLFLGSLNRGRHTVSSRVVPPRVERAGLGRSLDRPYRPELDGARAVPQHGAHAGTRLLRLHPARRF